MKDVKFRVWDKKSREMVNINRIDIGDGSCKPSIFGDVVYDYWNDVELMQYTGVKDKNGKEIYEGDIIEYYDSFDECMLLAEIEFKKGYFVMKNKRIEWLLGTINEFDEVKVVGNVFESKD